MHGHAFTVPVDYRLDDEIPSGFDIHAADPSGVVHRVVVEISKERALYARAREWHRAQTVDVQPDGSVLVSFPCSNLTPVLSWVLTWGRQARVIAPRELRDTVKAEADAMGALHS